MWVRVYPPVIGAEVRLGGVSPRALTTQSTAICTSAPSIFLATRKFLESLRGATKLSIQQGEKHRDLRERYLESGAFQPAGHDTSTSLLDRVKDYDEDAWRQLTELYGPLIYHWCRKSGLHSEDAADLLQDIYRSVLIHIHRFEKSLPSGSFRAWLWTITRNRIRDFARGQSGKAQAVGGSEFLTQLLALPAVEPEAFDQSDLAANVGLTLRAFEIIKQEIKETTWLAFWRSTIDEVDSSVVASELEISVESVWQAKSRVLRRFRQLLH